MSVLLKMYAVLFARPGLRRFNTFMFRCGLRGLGVLNHQDDWISGESHFLRGYFRTRRDGVVLDVGANVGRYCQAVASACPTALIHAFEPHPTTHQHLVENVRGLSVDCHNVAVGMSDGEAELFDYAQSNGTSHASLYQDVIEVTHASPSVARPVRVVCLDEFLDEHDIERVALLKIDTEGHELKVLLGAIKHLRAGQIAAIQFEFNEMNVSSRSFFRDFWELLPNYDLFRLLPHGALPIDRYSPLYCELFGFQNIVAILRDDSKSMNR